MIIVDGGIAHRWRNKPIQDIAKRDVIRLLDEIVDRGAGVMANRTLAHLRRMFNWCIERDLLTTSPCAGLTAPAPETSRDRILSDDEIRWLWKATETSDFPFGPLVRLLLVTAQRKDEVGGMVRKELAEDVWTIPAERAKNNREHHVPLSDLAQEILAGVPQIEGRAGYVFTTNGKSPVSGFSRAKEKLDREMLTAARKGAKETGGDPEEVSIPHWTFHDLRRTAASGMARLGQPVHVVEAILNHKSGTIRGVAAVYNRYSYAEEKAKALEAWGRFVESLVVPVEETNVVALTRASA